MSRRTFTFFPAVVLALLISLVSMTGDAVAAMPSTTAYLVAAAQGGSYLSWWKLLSIVGAYLFWVWASDWINRDSVKIEKEAELSPSTWNLIGVICLLAGFFAAISIPIFWVGFPLLLIAVVAPVIAYRSVRKAKMKESQAVRRKLNPDGDDTPSEVLAQDQGVALTFTPAGASDAERKSALIKARQSEAFVDLKELLHQGQFKRADIIQIDYTQSNAAPKLFVDGMWHALPPMDRARGDALLVSLKNIGGLNPLERRKKQSGSFAIKSEIGKANLQLASQGVKTGEQVRISFVQSSSEILKLPQLGMFPSMASQFVKSLNEPGICIVSSPKKQGLTSTWQGVLFSADRLTRDCIVVKDAQEVDSDVENIGPKEFQSDETAVAFLKKTMMSQPDSVAVPRVPSPEFMDLLTVQANQQQRSVWLRANANSAAEALLKTYALAGNRADFRQAIKYVTCQRLARRLCDHCKQDIPVSPKMIQQLGGDPSKIKTISGPWKLPPPDQRVDERGQEIEFPTCQTCGGIGYIGRIAIFEMIKVNDTVREALRKTPQVAAIDAAARESKAKKTMKSSAFQLVLMGLTSYQEVQNVLSPK